MLRSKENGKTNWGDKTPHYLLDLDIINSLFPYAKYIYIIRDGRDVALSLLRKRWGPNNIYACAHTWKCYNTVHTDTLHNLRNKKLIYELKYEDILQNPETKISEIYDFLNEELNNDKIMELIKSMKRDNFSKWKIKMNDKQIKLFENIAADCLKTYGYITQYENKPINIFLRLLFVINNKFKWVLWFIYENTIIQFKIKFLNHKPFGYE